MSNLRRTFSKRLSRNILILAIPLFVLALGVFYKNATRLLYDEATERSTTTLNTTIQLVENYLSAIETAARSNAWMFEEHFTPDSIEAVSRRIISLNNSVISCTVSAEPETFPAYGRYFSVYTVNEGDTIISMQESEFEYFEKNWYKQPLRTGHPCWINPFSDFHEGAINHHDAVGSFCIPLRPNGSHIAGVVSVDFSFQKLRETVLATNHPYPSSYYMLLGPVGGYLIHPDQRLLFKQTIFSANDSTSHPDIIALGREMIAGHSGTTHVKFGDEVCHVCYAPVADTGWSLALVCHEDDVLEDYLHLASITIVIIIIGLLLILWITRRVVQRNIGPVNELMEATKKIAEGNYEEVIPASTHKGVVGKMQNAFRKMQLAILSHINDIKQTDKEIEEESAKLKNNLLLAQEASKRKQTFIQNVSRQLANPIGVIESMAEVLKERIIARVSGKNEDHQHSSEYIQYVCTTMKHQAVQLQRITLMLYDSSETAGADTSRYEKNDDVYCNDFAQECATFVMKNYPTKVDIQFKSEVADKRYIKTNQLFLKRTICELLYNAAKYSDGLNILLHVTESNTAVRFIIEDKGPGLPKNSERLLFEPFTKVDDFSQGLGLGLPLCKNHIERLGGNLIYDPSYQQGCRFIIEMPKPSGVRILQ